MPFLKHPKTKEWMWVAKEKVGKSDIKKHPDLKYGTKKEPTDTTKSIGLVDNPDK